MPNTTFADDIDDTDGAEVIIDDYAYLDAAGEVWDLNNPDDVNQLVEHLAQVRQKLKADEAGSYENTGTDWGEGGRARLRYDQTRAELAQDYHAGKSDLAWEQQHKAAMDKVRIIAIANRHRWA